MEHPHSTNIINYNNKMFKAIKSLEFLAPLDSVNNQYDMDLINKFFICGICKNILNNPKQCNSCEEIFCEECLNSFYKNNTYCINSCTDIKILKPHITVINFLEKLKFNCIFNCGEIIPYNEVDKHLTKDCTKMLTTCKFLNCKFVGTSEEINKHIKICELQELFCPICKDNFPKNTHNCADKFLDKYNKLKAMYTKISTEYLSKFNELEELSNTVHNKIKSKITSLK